MSEPRTREEIIEDGRALAALLAESQRTTRAFCEVHQRTEKFRDACPVCGRSKNDFWTHYACLKVRDPVRFEWLCERERSRLRAAWNKETK